MLTPQFVLPLNHELVIDLFAGGGGASTGIEQALGRNVDIAVNHDPEAVSLHEANHPQTRHFVSDVFEVDPLVVTDGQPVGLLWASPDCKHFSKAKGGKPVSKKIRGLAWVVVKWAKLVRPRVICLENVEEFVTWGPLAEDGRPCPARKGLTFARWRKQLENLGYVIEHRELRACDFGAPTIRKRFFLVARCDGERIVWPTPTHGAGLRQYRTAADCIDWSLSCPSIFERERPLADATLRRIAHGIKRYVIEAANPYIVRVRPTGRGDGDKVRSIRDQPSMIAANLIDSAHSDVSPSGVKRWSHGNRPVTNPMPTITASGGNQALVTAFLAKHFGGEPAPGKTAQPIDKPAPTVMARGGPQALVTSNLVKLRGTSTSADIGEPLHTVSAQGLHHAEVQVLLTKYYGTGEGQELTEPLHTVTTRDRFGLVTVSGADYLITDIGMRMLQPRELYRAQGFPETYQIERGADGRALTKKAQVRMCGNSVCPPLARALVAANYSAAQRVKEAA